MPPRFVEVLDVQSEIASVFAQVVSSGQELAGRVQFNVSDYFNASTTDKLVEALEAYNISTEDIARTLNVFNLTNTSISEVPPPTGMAGYLIASGVGVLFLRYAIVGAHAKSLVRKYGHAHAE